MNDSLDHVWQAFAEHLRETAAWESIAAVLGWDERTMLPPGGAEYRAEQLTLLAGMLHRRHTDPRLGGWLEQLADSPWVADPTSDRGATILRTAREFKKQSKLPQSLVEELARCQVIGQRAWSEARQKDDFAAFLPHLERMVALKRQQAEAVGYDAVPYDALLDDYEPEATTAEVRATLAGLRDALIPLVQAIAASSASPSSEILHRDFPVPAQRAFGEAAARAIGFSFDHGRLDVTDHPFCQSVGPGDCRITTRYEPRFFSSAFFGTLHEAGHGMYEQGLRDDQYGLPPGKATSLGIHESQSRMWENQVGRSLAFWEHFFPQAQQTFPAALKDVSLADFHFAVNQVRPSLIRVEADEATYNLHIIVRFELEQELIDGRLQAADLPAAWRERYEKYLQITPPNDADGVLQDIHWSAGLFGYFPTYALGNLYAAQFYQAAESALGSLPALFREGEFAPLREFLRTEIHHRGQCETAAQLVTRITGSPLSHQPLIGQLTAKLGPLYQL